MSRRADLRWTGRRPAPGPCRTASRGPTRTGLAGRRRTSLARPKSVIFSVPSAESSTLAGLRSRWTTRPVGVSGPRGPAPRQSGRLPAGVIGCRRAGPPGCRRRSTRARSRRGRRARRSRGSGRCSDAGAGRRPRPRCGTAPRSAAPGVGAGEDHLQGDDAGSAPSCRAL